MSLLHICIRRRKKNHMRFTHCHLTATKKFSLTSSSYKWLVPSYVGHHFLTSIARGSHKFQSCSHSFVIFSPLVYFIFFWLFLEVGIDFAAGRTNTRHISWIPLSACCCCCCFFCIYFEIEAFFGM